jgi:hypothetical protein
VFSSLVFQLGVDVLIDGAGAPVYPETYKVIIISHDLHSFSLLELNLLHMSRNCGPKFGVFSST